MVYTSHSRQGGNDIILRGLVWTAKNCNPFHTPAILTLYLSPLRHFCHFLQAGLEQAAEVVERQKQAAGGSRAMPDWKHVQTEQGKLQLFVAIDRTCKLAYAERHTDKKKMTAVQFLRNVIAALPYKTHTLLTDNGAQFTHRKQDKPASMHLFDRVCQEHDIEHRLTKINHSWTNGQVERMNRTIKEATVKRYHYSAHE